MLNEACWDPDRAPALGQRGDDIGGGTAEEFAARVRREHAEWDALAREAGIRAR